MIKSAFASLLEAVHLASTSFLFVCAFWTSAWTDKVRGSKYVDLPSGRSGRIGAELSPILQEQGIWLAVGALFLAGAVGFLRADARKLTALLRLTAAGGAVLMILWATSGISPNLIHRPWNGLLIATGANLLFTAFMIGGGKGGSSSGVNAGDKKR